METVACLIFIAVALLALWFLCNKERKRQQLYDMLRVYEVYLRWLSLSERAHDVCYHGLMEEFCDEMNHAFSCFWDENNEKNRKH